MQKTLDEIVIEDDVKDHIRPLFDQATASDDISFEHDFQWQAYCDLLYSVRNFEEDVKKQKEKKGLYQLEYKKRRAALKETKNPEAIDALLGEIVQDTVKICQTGINSLTIYDHENRELLRNALTEIGKKTYIELDGDNDPLFIRFSDKEIEKRVEEIVSFMNNTKSAICKGLKKSIPLIYERIENGSWNEDIIGEIQKLPELEEAEFQDLDKFLLMTSQRSVIRPLDRGMSRKREENGYDYAKKVIMLLQRDEYKIKKQEGSRAKEAIECAEIDIHNYKIIHRIGEGSGRIAYRAWDEEDECYVAIKITKKETDMESSNRKGQLEEYGEVGLAKKEGHAAKQLSHKNIIRYFGRGSLSDGRAYIIEEYVDGLTLEAFINLVIDEDETWALQAPAPLILQQIIEGVAYLHGEGYIHRDIKPGNVLIPDIFRYYGQDWLTKIGEVRLGDLELAKKIWPKNERSGKHGSRSYAAPEVLQSGTLSHAADIFSLGIMMYEVFMLQHPFLTEKKRELTKEDKKKIMENICEPDYYPQLMQTIRNATKIPEIFKPLIEKALQPNPKERYQNGEYLLSDLKERIERKAEKERRQETLRVVRIGTIIMATITALGIGAWQIPTYFEEKRIAHDAKVAEQTYNLAEKMEADRKNGGTTEANFESARFLYRVASNLDPTNAKAKERTCMRDAKVLTENIILKEARRAGIEEIYLLDSLNKGILFERNGGATDIIFPDLEETIVLCEKAIRISYNPDPNLFLRVAQVYELKGEYKKAIKNMKKYALLSVVEEDNPEAIKETNARLAELYEKDGRLKEAFELGDDTLKARVAVLMYQQGKAYSKASVGEKKIKVNLIGEALESSIRAIEEAESTDQKAEKKKRKDEENESNKELSELYYTYGIARLLQYQNNQPDYPGKYALDKEKRKEFPQSKKKTKKEQYTPKPLEDALTALLNAAVLNPNEGKIYSALAVAYGAIGNQYEQEQAYKWSTRVDAERKMQKEEIELYRDVYPFEVSVDIFSFRFTSKGEPCNPFFVFDWYEQRYNSDLRLTCRPASFFGNLEQAPGETTTISGLWFEHNTDESGSIYVKSTYITDSGTEWEGKYWEEKVFEKFVLEDNTEFLAPIKNGDKIRFVDKY